MKIHRVVFAAMMAVVSLFASNAVLAQDDESDVYEYRSAPMESVTFEGMVIPERGDATMKVRRASGDVWACPEKDRKVAAYMATFKPGVARFLMLSDSFSIIDSSTKCTLVEQKK